MNILIAMTNYGTKNADYAKRLIAEYRSMPFNIDIVVFCESSKGYGSGAVELVGLPTKDPWSLPFAHKQLFAERATHYDLFIYTEDDMLVHEDNIRAFLRASKIVPEYLLPGFIQYEVYSDGRKHYCAIHGPYHWIPGSVNLIGGYVFASFSNHHSACYMLTRQQLQRAIRSGGFLVPPHSGRYDMACTAATDPYTQCGFSRVICISHLEHFELHHLPNAYLNRLGSNEQNLRLQVSALFDILQKNLNGQELFVTEKTMATSAWDKDYYEPCRTDLLEHIPPEAVKILSVGCGSGITEAHLVEAGKKVTAIPLDSVIGGLVQRRGIRLLPPDFSEAFELLDDERFDVILLGDVLQHLEDPIDIFSRLGKHLEPEGLIVGSVPNLALIRRFCARLIMKNQKWASVFLRRQSTSPHGGMLINTKWESVGRGFAETALHITSSLILKKWLKRSGLRRLRLRYEGRSTSLERLSLVLPGQVEAPNIVFVAQKFSA